MTKHVASQAVLWIGVAVVVLIVMSLDVNQWTRYIIGGGILITLAILFAGLLVWCLMMILPLTFVFHQGPVWCQQIRNFHGIKSVNQKVAT